MQIQPTQLHKAFIVVISLCKLLSYKIGRYVENSEKDTEGKWKTKKTQWPRHTTHLVHFPQAHSYFVTCQEAVAAISNSWNVALSPSFTHFHIFCTPSHTPSLKTRPLPSYLISSSLAKMMTARAWDVSRRRRMILSNSPALGSRGILTDCATHTLPVVGWNDIIRD